MDGDRGQPYWMDGAHHAHDEWWHGPLHLLLLLVFVGLLVLGIVWLVRRLSLSTQAVGVAAGGGVATTGLADPAVAELRLRYARGEVDRNAYLQSFADLTGQTEPGPGQAPSDAPTATPPAPGD